MAGHGGHGFWLSYLLSPCKCGISLNLSLSQVPHLQENNNPYTSEGCGKQFIHTAVPGTE